MMGCANCPYEAVTARQLAQHRWVQHGDRRLLDKLKLPLPPAGAIRPDRKGGGA